LQRDLKNDYKKDFVLDDFKIKNERIKMIFSISNRSLTCAIDAIYVSSKFKCFKLVILVYTIYLMKNVKNLSDFRI